MARSRPRIGSLAVATCIWLGAAASGWGQAGPEVVGEISVIQQRVTVTRAGTVVALPMHGRKPVLFGDVLETGPEARVQSVFRDDTVLTLGPGARVEISEYLHDPGQQVRRMTVLLAKGTVRSLVGRTFSGVGSTFVIKTEDSAIIADSAYCVVWRTGAETGVANVGSVGAVSFVAGGRVVVLGPGTYAIAETGKPPGVAEKLGDRTPPAVRQAVQDTEVRDQPDAPATELAEQPIEEKLPSCPPGSPPGGVCPRQAPPTALPPSTPPAVTSGAIQR